jgi:hypothetical protein
VAPSLYPWKGASWFAQQTGVGVDCPSIGHLYCTLHRFLKTFGYVSGRL